MEITEELHTFLQRVYDHLKADLDFNHVGSVLDEVMRGLCIGGMPSPETTELQKSATTQAQYQVRCGHKKCKCPATRLIPEEFAFRWLIWMDLGMPQEAFMHPSFDFAELTPPFKVVKVLS